MVNFTLLCCDARPQLTFQTLESIGSHEGANVTILADRVSDQFREKIELWGSKQDNRKVVHNSETMGTGLLRNKVINLSQEVFGRGDYLYLSDNDIYVLRPNWLECLTSCYEDGWQKKFELLGAYNYPSFYGEYSFAVIGAYNHPYHQPIGSVRVSSGFVINEVYAVALQSMLMRWEVWDKYGPFCETPVGKVCQGEDVDFTNKIRADGYKVGVVCPALLVNTGITNSFGEKIPGWELVKAQCPPGVICE